MSSSSGLSRVFRWATASVPQTRSRTRRSRGRWALCREITQRAPLGIMCAVPSVSSLTEH
jgi:hypothetical protein